MYRVAGISEGCSLQECSRKISGNFPEKWSDLYLIQNYHADELMELTKLTELMKSMELIELISLIKCHDSECQDVLISTTAGKPPELIRPCNHIDIGTTFDMNVKHNICTAQ